jgi:hypothetical protein
MKMIRLWRELAAVGLAVASVSWAASAQEAKPKPAEPSKATDPQEVLMRDIGVWDAKIKAYLNGPDAAPNTSDGVETVRLLEGSRWLTIEVQGEFGGMPFRGHGHYGYDPFKKKYVGSWVDNHSVALLISEGTYDEGTKTLTSLGETVDPTGKAAKFKEVCVYKEDGKRHVTMYLQSADTGDKMLKLMERDYTRRPSAEKRAK